MDLKSWEGIENVRLNTLFNWEENVEMKETLKN